MSRQRHWVNHGKGGDCLFLTTTVLDFVHAFRRESPRGAMAQAILQKVRYIHWNPVKAGLATTVEEYRWSSAPLWAAGLWDEERGLPLRLDL